MNKREFSLWLIPAEVKVVFTSSLFVTTGNVQGLKSLDFSKFPQPMLWVHNAQDPCQYTPYSDAVKMAKGTSSPLITVHSSSRGTGPECKAFSRHGYFGVEKEVVAAIKKWIQDGVAQDVGAR